MNNKDPFGLVKQVVVLAPMKSTAPAMMYGESDPRDTTIADLRAENDRLREWDLKRGQDLSKLAEENGRLRGLLEEVVLEIDTLQSCVEQGVEDLTTQVIVVESAIDLSARITAELAKGG